MQTLQELFQDEIKDIYSAENQILKALPRISKRVSNSALKEALNSHLEETRNQVTRLETIGKRLGFRLSGKKCHGMEGLVEEGKEVMDEVDEEGALLDAGLIGAVQRVEHYEIAAYGTARAIA